MVWYDSNGMIATIGLMEVSKAEELVLPKNVTAPLLCRRGIWKGACFAGKSPDPNDSTDSNEMVWYESNDMTPTVQRSSASQECHCSLLVPVSCHRGICSCMFCW